MKRKKIRSFSRRLMRRIGLAQLLVMGLASWFIYTITYAIVKDEETKLYQSYLRVSNQAVGRVLSDVQVSTTNRVDEIRDLLDKPDQLTSLMRHIVETNPGIRSCGLSFVANYYPQKGRWFCPYAVRPDSGAVETRIVGSANNDYLSSEWFQEAVSLDSAYWSKPFFDSADTITPLAAYLIPIHDKTGRLAAVLGADLKLNLFSGHKVIDANINGKDVKIYLNDHSVTTGKGNIVDDDEDNSLWTERLWRLVNYNFIIDGDGTFIYHPDSSHILRKNYFELAKATADTIDDYIGHQMVAGKSGTYNKKRGEATAFNFFDTEGASSYVFYQHIAHTNWSIGLVVPKLFIDGYAIGFGIIMVILIGLALLVTRIVGRIVIKRTMKPLSMLAQSANEVAKGNFNAPLPRIKHNDEIRLMRDSFEGMQHSLAEYVEELKATTSSKAAIENELKVAHDIQMSMLPKTFPPFPERSDVDVYGSLTPAKDVGGDLFDFYIRDEQLYFCIGDVSGKGIPASLLMAVTRSLFRNISSYLSEPHRIVGALNASMSDSNDETSMFVTLFVGVLDLQTGVLHYSNAGHDAPLLIGGNEVAWLPCDPNLPIGVMEDWEFTCQKAQLEPQTTLFLFTDGLNEAEDTGHVQFGNDRVLRVANDSLASHQTQPATLVSRMLAAVHRFVDEAEQSDDLTLLAIQYMKEQ